jgi:hypothetical protein
MVRHWVRPATRPERPATRLAHFAVSLALAAAALPGVARAQAQMDEMHCAPTPELAQMLERRFGVRRAGSGLRSPDEMMELWRDEAGDWALVARYAQGTSCIVAMGAHWSGAEPQG